MVLKQVFLDTVSATIQRHKLLDPSDRVLVAFSGGADSTALVLALRSLNYDLAVGHVDHRMRASSTADAEHCQRTAAQLEISFHLRTLEVPPRTEAAARDARYKALEEMRREAGATKIATGHTKNDQVETVLMRMQRGGKAWGIPPKRGHIVRPLIETRRKETEAICRESEVPFVVDPSNIDLSMKRNLIRTKQIPGLDDRALASLLDAASLNRAFADQIRARVDRAVDEGKIAIHPHRRVELSAAWIEANSQAVVEAAIRRAAEELGVDLTTHAVGDVERKVIGRAGSSLDLARGLRAWAESERLIVGFPEIGAVPAPVVLRVPGTTLAEQWGLRVEAEIQGNALLDAVANTACMDLDRAGDYLALRTRRPGDRFHPFGSRGRKKIQDFFVDQKIPRGMRDRIPLCVNGKDEIVWVVGHRLDNRFKVTPKTTRVLRLSVEPLIASLNSVL